MAKDSLRDLFESTTREFLAPLRGLLDDPSITEIMVNDADHVFVERHGRIERSDVSFASPRHLESAANAISQFVGKMLSRDAPRVDARLPDGSRVHLIGPPASRSGVCFSIRRFPAKPLTGRDLIEKYGAITEQALDFLGRCVGMHLNLVVSGGTGSGKTSLLNALSAFIDPRERILVIEDTSELNLIHDHVLRLEASPKDEHGRGGVSIRELFHSALRMRPDRVLIGEVRDREALDLVQALTSGHSGSMTTVHASRPGDALCRLETLCLYADSGLPLPAIRTQLASAVNIIVQASRMSDGSRRVTEIAEVLPLSLDGTYRLATIYGLRYWTGHGGQRGPAAASLEPIGTPPSFVKEAALQGYDFPPSLFERSARDRQGAELDDTGAEYTSPAAPVADAADPGAGGP